MNKYLYTLCYGPLARVHLVHHHHFLGEGGVGGWECVVVVMDLLIISGHCTPAMIFNFGPSCC